jgi:hypothetical protein
MGGPGSGRYGGGRKKRGAARVDESAEVVNDPSVSDPQTALKALPKVSPEEVEHILKDVEAEVRPGGAKGHMGPSWLARRRALADGVSWAYQEGHIIHPPCRPSCHRRLSVPMLPGGGAVQAPQAGGGWPRDVPAERIPRGDHEAAQVRARHVAQGVLRPVRRGAAEGTSMMYDANSLLRAWAPHLGSEFKRWKYRRRSRAGPRA